MKQRIRHEQDDQNPESYLDVDEERQKLLNINPLQVVDYIKASFDILINLRMEAALMEQEQELAERQEQRHQHGPKKQKRAARSDDDEEHYINSSRGGHGAPLNNLNQLDSPRSSVNSNQPRPGVSESVASSSALSSREGPPKVYEELI